VTGAALLAPHHRASGYTVRPTDAIERRPVRETNRSLCIAMIGTRGVPARYGGFEAAVEEVGRRLAARGHQVVVYCRNNGQTAIRHDGMTLVNLPAIRHKYTETLSHTALSIAHAALRGTDVAIVFNAANAALIPALQARSIPVAVHVDGLEWRRSKWSGVGRHYYARAEKSAVRRADHLIADARAIQDYYSMRYGAATTFIPYGAAVLAEKSCDRLNEVGLSAGAYHLVVARMEPENNVHVIVRGYVDSGARLPLAVVGRAPYAEKYEAVVRRAASGRDAVIFLGSVWDQGLLDQLYANARLYAHGHSVGGTNPSLLRAMGAGTPVAAFDVVFNREVLRGSGMYFRDARELGGIMRWAEDEPEEAFRRGLAGQQRVAQSYDWDHVAGDYEQLCLELFAARPQFGPRVQRRRRPKRPALGAAA
jgi:glycosyltransferase involved in cell wall biosynthesis